MAFSGPFNYKNESQRYDYYYRRLQRFYEKPITQVSTAVLFTLGTIIFFGVFAIKPTLETISNLLKTIEEKEVLLQKAEQKSAALGTAQQQLDQFESYMPGLAAAIPDRSDIQSLLKQLEALASQDGIPLQSLRISEVTYPEDTTKQGIQEIQFTLSVSSDYPKDKVFLQDLEKIPRLTTVESVSFQPDSSINRTETSLIQMSVICKTYMNSQKKI